MNRPTRRLYSLMSAGLAMLVLSGCAARAQVSVLRPAVLNARQFGGTMSVEAFEGHPMAAAAVAQDLRQRIMTAEGSPIALVEGGGALLVHGAVPEYDYRETIDENQQTCTRNETDSNGESYTVEYQCTEYTRRGTARVAIAFNVTVSGTGQTIISTTYEDSDGAVRTATDETPGHINGDAMLTRMRADLTEQFARVILPWRETVQVRLGRCGGGDARAICDQGIEAFRATNFATAATLFERAIALLEFHEAPDAGHLAQAWWNLALAREYDGDWGGAFQAIGRAAHFDPNNQAYARELHNVQRMADEARRLEEQGVVPTQ